MVEATKVVDGTLTMQCLARNKMGAMCSDRESLYRLEMKELSPGKYMTISTTFERDDVPCSPDAVRCQYFKGGQYEQKGDDLHCLEFQSMDLMGYFPKSLMNKL